jgi:ATP phosphoribosyltransferase
MPDDVPLTIAVPKGRTLRALLPLLTRAGIDCAALAVDDRTLVRTADGGRVRYLLLKPDDVPTYVDYGAADLGFCGRDVLDERGLDLYRPVDLNAGVCRMVVAAPKGRALPSRLPRVATKYPRTATAFFAQRGVQVEVIYVQGSVELAPWTGLADLIVDLVETGTTLEQNGLEVVDDVARVATVVVANRVSFKLRSDARAYVDALRRVVG